jgi:triacylglycerol lipase
MLLGCGGSDEAFSKTTPKPVDAGADAVEDRHDVPDVVIEAAVEAGVDAPPKLGPPYPIVLLHGFFGFDTLAGLDAITYFHGVKTDLAAAGEGFVFTPAVDPFNDSTSRGAEVAEFVQQVVDETGYEKVNLIGHSQGGLDARVVAHDHPELVASVTTFATPHLGTPVADVILGAVSDPNAQQIIDWFVKQLGYALWDATGNQTSVWKPLELFSEAGITQFNATYTDAPGVLYFSFSGRSDLKLNESECAPDEELSFVEQWNLEVDTVDPLLSLTEAFLDGGFGQPSSNDGLVRAEDARWGKFLGCVPADHLDEVGQLLGDSPGLGNQWNHLDFYRGVVAYLRTQGL